MAEATTYEREKEEMEKIFHIVAKKANSGWKWLGRKLNVDNAVIEEIEADYRGQSEKAFQVLMKWFQMNGQNATKEVLYVALRKVGYQSVVDVIEQQLNFAGYENGISFENKVYNPRHAEKIPCQPPKPKAKTTNFKKNVERSPKTSQVYTSLQNGYSCHPLESFDGELKKMFDDCVENLTPDTCCVLLVNKLKTAQHVQELNTILTRLSHGFNDEVISKSCTIRSEQTDQLIRLILNAMTRDGETRKMKSHRTRSASEHIPRRASMVKLQPRSGTFSTGLSRISSPISTSRQCLFSKESSPGFPNQICEEVFSECEQPEDQGMIPRCDSCGSCLSFEVKQDFSGMKDMKVDENRNENYESGLISQETNDDNDEKENHYDHSKS